MTIIYEHTFFGCDFGYILRSTVGKPLRRRNFFRAPLSKGMRGPGSAATRRPEI